jgi:hypothetical protein
MAGFSRRGSRNIAEIADALHAAGIKAAPQMGLVESLDHMVSFTAAEQARPAVTTLQAAISESPPPATELRAQKQSRRRKSVQQAPAAEGAPSKPKDSKGRGCLTLIGIFFLCSLMTTNPGIFWLIVLGALGRWAHQRGWLDGLRLGNWADASVGAKRATGAMAVLVVLSMAGLAIQDDEGVVPAGDENRLLDQVRPEELDEPRTLPEKSEATKVATQAPTKAPTDKPKPTATSVPPTATTIPPSRTPLPPTDPPPPPTQAPPFNLDPNPDQNCDSFPSYATMQSWRSYWIARGVGNPGRLDGDGDGVACEDGEGGRPAAAPPPPPPPPVQAPAQPAERNCCKHCTPGVSKPCGNTCISINYNCHTPPGCACGG